MSQSLTITVADLIFTGFNKRVAALHRDTGQIIWQWKGPSCHTYTTLLLDGDRLIVSVQGYTYALDALTGCELWANDLPGFGTGVASLASVRGGSSPGTLLAQAAASDQAASAAVTAGTATT